MRSSVRVAPVAYQHAVEQLRKAGLVVTRAGKGTFVIAVPTPQTVDLLPGDQVTARMATEAEHQLPDIGSSPVFVVTRADGSEEVFPAGVVIRRPADR